MTNHYSIVLCFDVRSFTERDDHHHQILMILRGRLSTNRSLHKLNVKIHMRLFFARSLEYHRCLGGDLKLGDNVAAHVIWTCEWTLRLYGCCLCCESILVAAGEMVICINISRRRGCINRALVSDFIEEYVCFQTTSFVCLCILFVTKSTILMTYLIFR